MPEKGLKRIVVLGVGNTLLKDEGVGVKVIEALRRRFDFPPEVALVDGGVRGLGLVPIIKEAEDLIIIDAVRKGQAPGTLYRLTDEDLCARVSQKNSLHQVDLMEALTVAQAFGETTPSIIVLGVEPLDVSPWGMELTPIIEARVDELVALAVEELGRLGVKCQPRLKHGGLE